MLIKVLNRLGRRVNELTEDFNKEKENIYMKKRTNQT